jgi:hypothetical protein
MNDPGSADAPASLAIDECPYMQVAARLENRIGAREPELAGAARHGPQLHRSQRPLASHRLRPSLHRRPVIPPWVAGCFGVCTHSSFRATYQAPCLSWCRSPWSGRDGKAVPRAVALVNKGPLTRPVQAVWQALAQVIEWQAAG